MGYEFDFEFSAITLPDWEIVGAQNLLVSPVLDDGGRIAKLRDIQELRGIMAHWQGAYSILRFFAEPVNRVLSLADSTETWVRCTKWGHWVAFGLIVSRFGIPLNGETIGRTCSASQLENYCRPTNGRQDNVNAFLFRGQLAMRLSRVSLQPDGVLAVFRRGVADFAPSFANSQDVAFVNANKLTGRDAMVVDWAGNSIS